MSKKQRITKSIRSQSRTREKHPCYVCGEHELITHQHHVIPVAQMAEDIERHNYEQYPMPTVWLCPNHHAYYHLIESADDRQWKELFATLDINVMNKLTEIMAAKNDALIDLYGIRDYDHIPND